MKLRDGFEKYIVKSGEGGEMERGERDKRKSECEGGEDKNEGGREYHTMDGTLSKTVSPDHL